MAQVAPGREQGMQQAGGATIAGVVASGRRQPLVASHSFDALAPFGLAVCAMGGAADRFHKGDSPFSSRSVTTVSRLSAADQLT